MGFSQVFPYKKMAFLQRQCRQHNVQLARSEQERHQTCAEKQRGRAKEHNKRLEEFARHIQEEKERRVQWKELHKNIAASRKDLNKSLAEHKRDLYETKNFALLEAFQKAQKTFKLLELCPPPGLDGGEFGCRELG